MAKSIQPTNGGNQAPTELIAWECQPGPQSALITCPVFETFYGGARGGGKTDGCLGEFAVHADQYGENAIGLMVRRSRTELIETMERSRQIYTRLGARYNDQDKLWRFPNGARLRFAYLENDSDAEAYQGHSYTRLYVEEAGTFPSPDPIFKLFATLRSSAGVPVRVILTGNPGGPGQAWLFDRYIAPNPNGWEIITSDFVDPYTGQALTRDRVFIPSKVKDNKYLGPDYVAGLQMVGSPQLVKAWLDGDWTAIIGAFFPEFSARHWIRPFEVPEHWTRLRGIDWGSGAPFSVGWWAVSDGERVTNIAGESVSYPRGALICYREWYGASRPNVGLHLTSREVAQGILQRQQKGERIDASVGSPDMWAKNRGHNAPSIAEELATNGVVFKPAINDRKNGWQQLRGRLVGADDGPMIYAFDTCIASRRTVPILPTDPNKPEDVDPDCEDHCGEQWRYVAMARPWIRQAPAKPKPLRSLDQATFAEVLAMGQARRNERIF